MPTYLKVERLKFKVESKWKVNCDLFTYFPLSTFHFELCKDSP
jgi:hypothetical protein